jgi:hypothetical protein
LDFLAGNSQEMKHWADIGPMFCVYWDFLQHQIIMLEDAETKACKELGIFLSLVTNQGD